MTPSSNKARLLIVLLLDTSGSMAGQRIQALSNALQAFIDSLKAEKTLANRTDIAIITFGSEVRVHAFENILQFQPPTLFAEGATPLGNAVQQALSLIDDWKENRKQNKEDFYRPIVVLLTDGEPTDDWQYAAAQVRDQVSLNALNFVSIGIEGANLEVLSEFSRKNKPLLIKETEFANLFAWTSQSVSVVANAEVGQEVKTLPPTWVETSPPPIYFYTEIETPALFEVATTHILLHPPHGQRITPEYLSTVLSPFLNALADIHDIVDKMQGRVPTGIFILSITQNSPIGVSLEGVPEVLRLIVEVFDKGRRERIRKMEEYTLQAKRLELETKRLEHQELNMRLARETEELRRLKIENNRAQFELELEIAEASINLVGRVAPQLSETDKLVYVGRLLKPVGVLMTSDLEIGRRTVSATQQARK